MNKHNKLSLRDQVLRANSLSEIDQIAEKIAEARRNTMSDKTYKRCRNAIDLRTAELKKCA